MKTVVEEIEAHIARVGTDPVYGYAHCLRVFALAEELAASEEVSYDAEILRVGPPCTAVGLYSVPDPQGSHPTTRSARRWWPAVSSGLGFPPAGEPGCHRGHRTPPARRVHKRSPSETILPQDAIALDYLGAIGISRMLAMVGTEDDVPDIRSAIWNAESLRQKIPDLLVLQSSKDLASRRIREMEDFLEDLRDATAKLKLL